MPASYLSKSDTVDVPRRRQEGSGNRNGMELGAGHRDRHDLGVLGGLISLGFVVYQVRRNATAIEGATVQGLMALEVQVFAVLAEHADVYQRGAADLASLTPAERFRFNRLVACKMSLLNTAFVQFEQRLIDEDVWQAYVRGFQQDIQLPGYLATWQAISVRYPEGFRNSLPMDTLVPDQQVVA